MDITSTGEMEIATAVRSLTVLDFGRGDIDMGYVIAPGDLDGQWLVCPFPGYLIELVDGRHILIDTGPHRRHITEPMFEFADSDFGDHLRPLMTPADDPVNRLRELDLTPDEIDILVVTHTHFDHSGNVADFASSEIVIHRDALADGRSRGNEHRPGGVPSHARDGRDLNVRVVEGDTEVAPGVTLLETPGHAPGHLSALVRLPDTGPVLLAIDAIYTRVNHERANYQVAQDSEQARRSAERIIQIAEREGAMLIYGHDPEQWAELKKAPERYT